MTSLLPSCLLNIYLTALHSILNTTLHSSLIALYNWNFHAAFMLSFQGSLYIL